MPELPEVETFARILRDGSPQNPSILGETILHAEIRWPKSLATPDLSQFLGQIQGQRVEAIQRRGKFLILQLTNHALLIHLRMSGDLIAFNNLDVDVPIHTRMILYFNNQSRLVFNDPRKFGRIWLVDHPDQVTGSLGPEPLDVNLTGELFHSRLLHVRRQIKPLLLDQHFLAGVGNIYSDEALHLAKIHPLRVSNTLSLDEAGNLLAAIRLVLTKGIEQNGASIDWVYRGGDFQNHFRVYGRTGEHCPVCDTIIEHFRVGQRSTHYCPVCQPQMGG